jgi:hypothetical protein
VSERRDDPVPSRQERPLAERRPQGEQAPDLREEGRGEGGDALLRRSGDEPTGDQARSEERSPTES